MIPPNAYQVVKCIQEDRLREAEKARLILRVHPPSLPFYSPAASWIGRRFVVWGFRLLVAAREWDHRAEAIYQE